ncbi:MAG: glucosaminidase domain-containing protein [Bacteroidales bacterium]
MKTFKQISSGLGVGSGCDTIIRKLKTRLTTESAAPRIILLGVIFLLNSYLVPGGSPAMTKEMKYREERSLFYFQIRYEPFSEELMLKCLEYEGVLYQEIALLQARLETGYYTSDIFLNGNNLFGMRYPSRRPTVATGVYKEHARYSHWSYSVIDYAMWQKYYLSRGYRLEGEIDSDFYLVLLKSIPYAEDPRYISKLVTLSEGDLT